MITIYGIKTCDTVRKALKWAEENDIEHEFHDFRKNPVAEAVVKKWEQAVGRDKLINKKGTTYRKLSDADKEILTGDNPYALLCAQPTIMKRPVFEGPDQILIGFTDAEKSALLANS